MPSASRRAWAALSEAWVEYQRDGAGYFAAAMIYYALVSLVPLLLLLTAALGLLLRFSDAAATVRERLLATVGAELGLPISDRVDELLEAVAQESLAATAVSIVGLLLTASLLFRSLRRTFRAIWHYEPPLAAGSLGAMVWQTALEQLVALAMVVGGGGLLLAALLVVAAARWALPLVGHAEWLGWLLTALGSFVLSGVTFALLFRYLPPVRLRWRDVVPSTLVCSIAWVVASEVLTLYGLATADTGTPYGALGGLLVVMVWMNVVSKVLFFGAELCKVIARRDLG